MLLRTLADIDLPKYKPGDYHVFTAVKCFNLSLEPLWDDSYSGPNCAWLDIPVDGSNSISLHVA